MSWTAGPDDHTTVGLACPVPKHFEPDDTDWTPPETYRIIQPGAGNVSRKSAVLPQAYPAPSNPSQATPIPATPSQVQSGNTNEEYHTYRNPGRNKVRYSTQRRALSQEQEVSERWGLFTSYRRACQSQAPRRRQKLMDHLEEECKRRYNSLLEFHSKPPASELRESLGELRLAFKNEDVKARIRTRLAQEDHNLHQWVDDAPSRYMSHLRGLLTREDQDLGQHTDDALSRYIASENKGKDKAGRNAFQPRYWYQLLRDQTNKTPSSSSRLDIQEVFMPASWQTTGARKDMLFVVHDREMPARKPWIETVPPEVLEKMGWRYDDWKHLYWRYEFHPVRRGYMAWRGVAAQEAVFKVDAHGEVLSIMGLGDKWIGWEVVSGLWDNRQEHEYQRAEVEEDEDEGQRDLTGGLFYRQASETQL